MAKQDEELLRGLLQTFYGEAAEHVQTLNQALLKLERQPEAQVRKELVQEAFRTAHSLKGAARAVGFDLVEQVANGLEDILKQMRDAELSLTPARCDVLYNALDTIQRLLKNEAADVGPLCQQLAAIRGDQSAVDATQPSAAQPARDDTSAPRQASEPLINNIEGEDTIRVGVAKLDALMAQAGELLVAKIGAEQRLADMQDLCYTLTAWPKVWREIKTLLPRVIATGDAGRQIGELLQSQYEYLQTVTRDVNLMEQAISRDTLHLGMVTGRLQDEVRRVRMIPFNTLDALLQRTVRDAARSVDKLVDFHLYGGEVEMDKKVLEVLKDPLLHLLRNAVGHGIEAPDKRAAIGKPAQGQVSITVRQHGGEVRLTVSDDGQGFDLAALREAAPNAANGSDDIISLAFRPGVTTSKQVTAISGRGIGLDVVRQKLEVLQGRIQVDNRPGHGVSIQLIVPVSLAMTRVLLVRIGSEQYALPLASVEKIVTLQSTFSVEGKGMVTVDGRPLPVVALATILRRPASTNKSPLVVIMGAAEQRLALLVDDVLTEQELAVKPLGKPLLRVNNIAGAAVLGNGSPVVVLHAADLIKSARGTPVHPLMVSQSEAAEDRPTEAILVVDDSITTRTLEKNILETAGYQVVTATDGTEAVQQLKQHPIALVVADVQMPNMDGISLTRYLRDSGDYREMPVILVTSLESREDRERGMLAGANAYIVKRGFNQAELLTTIEQLL